MSAPPDRDLAGLPILLTARVPIEAGAGAFAVASAGSLSTSRRG